MITKRVCDLVKGDIFVYDNVERVVFSIKDDKINFRSYLSNPQGSGRYSFGSKNQMKVEWLGAVAQKKRVTLQEPHDITPYF